MKIADFVVQPQTQKLSEILMISYLQEVYVNYSTLADE